MPSSRIWPFVDSEYESSRSWSTGSYFWPCDGVDVELAEQRVHAERAGLVGDDRHDPWPDVLVAGQVAQQAGEAPWWSTPPGRPSRRAARRTAPSPGSVERTSGAPVVRLGIEPSSALRRSIMYWYSSESLAERDVRRVLGVETLVGDLVVEVQPVAQSR